MPDLRKASRRYLDGHLSLENLVQAAIDTPVVDSDDANALFMQPILGYGNVDSVDEDALRRALILLLAQ